MGRKIVSYFAKQFYEKENPFLLIFAIKLIYSTFVAIIVGYFNPSAHKLPIDEEEIWIQLPLSVMIVPILETLVFQVLIIEIMRSFKVKDIYTILTSGLLFALSHNYNITYILVTFIPGLLYAFYYIRLRRTNDWFFSASFVFFVHGLYNLFVFFTKL